MACFEGISDRMDWWSRKPISMKEGAPFRLNEYISGERYLDINQALRYTNVERPSVEDKFHEIRQMMDAFNQHYEDNYIPSWLSCLDESMVIWLNKYCPGFMVVPRKPHPSGNEYHTIADGDDGAPILWRIKLQEGKDRPKAADGRRWLYPTAYDSHSKTAGLMLSMTKPIHGTGKRVTMDSGFSVTAGILAMDDVGVYGQSLAKKRKYWPKHVPGDAIDEYFKDKELGAAKTLKQNIDGKDFLIHCQKDDGYVTKMMSTHGLNEEVEDHVTQRWVNGERKRFKYTEPISTHKKAAHWVDDVNNRRHDPIGLEDTWRTKWWPDRQFTFLCELAESNAANSQARAKKESAQSQLDFRRKLACQMLENKIDDMGFVLGIPTSPIRLTLRRRPPKHELKTRDLGRGAWDPATRDFSYTEQEYQKTKCGTCKSRVRTYCRCNKSVTMCQECFHKHLRERTLASP